VQCKARSNQSFQLANTTTLLFVYCMRVDSQLSRR